MHHQLWLGLILVLSLSTLCLSDLASNAKDITSNDLNEDIKPLKFESINDDYYKRNSKLPKVQDSRPNKILSKNDTPVQIFPTTKAPGPDLSSVKLNDKTLLKDIEHSEIGKFDDEYEYNSDYYEDYDEDDKNSTNKLDGNKLQKIQKFDSKMKQMKETEQKDNSSALKILKKTFDIQSYDYFLDNSTGTNSSDDDAYDDVDEEDEEDEEGDDDSDDDLEENDSEDDDIASYASKDTIPLCPRDCICEKNMHSYIVATCNRLDLETQKFSAEITDLQVLDVEPKYPIVLGDEVFKKLGLKQVVSIKISNCSVEYISPTAFTGLDKLYSVNFTNIGINQIHPDTFANNTHLKLLTLSDNDLSDMQKKLPYTDYMLKAPSVEELDISSCNLQEMLPTAFTGLPKIVYINLSDNKLKTLPLELFDKVESIEELDLSMNEIVNLPKRIFNRTILSILHLKHNEIYDNINFITPDLQQLDLSYNKIHKIDGQMFRNTGGLNKLQLRGNAITKINNMAFTSMKNLHFIDLSFNDLDQISALVFLNNQRLETIKLNDNPRLKVLPSEGFESTLGPFHTYDFDVSNCAISNLAENTFSTMPELIKLNLAENKIKKLEIRVFSFLEKLLDLNLSNNDISHIPNSIFLHNEKLDVLNLAGNPLGNLSAKIFTKIPNLKQLDISECELDTMFIDTNIALTKFKIFPFLRQLNISNNDIINIRTTDLQGMNKLKIFDMTNNPLLCNDEFKNLIKWLGRKQISINDVRQDRGPNAKITLHDDILIAHDSRLVQEWNELANQICNAKTVDDQIIDDKFEFDDYYYDYPSEPVKAKTESNKNKVVDSQDKESSNEDSDSDESDEKEKVTLKEESDDDILDLNKNFEYYDNDDDLDVKITKTRTENIIKDVNILQKIESNILGDDYVDKDFEQTDDDDDDDIDNEEIVIDDPKLLMSYQYIWPILIFVFSVLTILVLLSKIISLCMRKRGERYRQALLASKNSIVYQKLSEDIYAPSTPLPHKYAPVEQV